MSIYCGILHRKCTCEEVRENYPRKPSMGKASRWIRSFLLGKKEKHKKIDILLLTAESFRDLNVLPKVSREKRRWSFRKSFTSPESNTNYKRSRSFDTSFASNTLLVKQSLQDCDVDRIRAIVSGMPANESTGILASVESHATRMQEDEAATKIQSIFRSYLARKALRALKGLVKIQALVRGHFVRKQTAAMIKRMQALMSIQIRARIHRVHLNEISQFEYGHIFSNHLDMETINIRNKRIGQPQAERREDYHNFGKKYDGSRRHSFSNLQQRHPTPSTWLARQSSPELYKVSQSLSHNKPEESNTKQITLPFTLPNMEDSYSIAGSHLLPTYMCNTESSRAKARSKSAPKQRPEWGSKQAGGQGFSVDFIDDERQHPWSLGAEN